jgi:two-component system chemotaxis response regulator CheB
MGEDGKDGCISIKNEGGNVMIQDQATSVVWGMPGAVHEAGAFDEIGSIDQCASTLAALLVRS